MFNEGSLYDFVADINSVSGCTVPDNLWRLNLIIAGSYHLALFFLLCINTEILQQSLIRVCFFPGKGFYDGVTTGV